MAPETPSSPENIQIPTGANDKVVDNQVTDGIEAPADPNYATWEDDETPATGWLRAACVLTIGALLAWAQWKTPYTPIGENWFRWVATSFVFNFALPLGLVWMFFGQGLVHQNWLKNQKHNAWDYGWKWDAWRRHLKLALILWAVMLPFLIYFSRQAEVRLSYDSYLPPTENPLQWAYLLASLVVYMFCWEWFFRGFGLFGMAQGWGVFAAIAIQAIGFGLAHSGKPPAEMWSAFGGGLLLGILCWREKSFVPAFFTHALVHCSFAVLVKI